MINVLGDALAAGIMAHICRKEFTKDGSEVGPKQQDNFENSLWYAEIAITVRFSDVI